MVHLVYLDYSTVNPVVKGHFARLLSGILSAHVTEPAAKGHQPHRNTFSEM